MNSGSVTLDYGEMKISKYVEIYDTNLQTWDMDFSFKSRLNFGLLI
jgi:hypothetical protein